MKTFSAKPTDITKKWLVIDANQLVLGRLASIVAKILMGKHKTTYTPSMDCGDNVIIINAEKIVLTGRKSDTKDGKMFYWHTGYMGGIKETTSGKILQGKHPQRVIIKAVERMITRNVLGRQRMSNLYVYAGAEHPHAGQKPEVLDVAAMNPKNKKGN
jgi:large subunit ribosomal protein L13